LTGCGGSDSDDDESTGYVNFYNASKNAPAIFFTLDEDLDDSSDDHVELTFNGVEYTKSLTNYQVETNSYFYELAWQDEDSATRDNLELVYEGEITVQADEIQFIVASENVASPTVNVYSIEKIDDEDDTDNDLFNVRVLNIHPESEPVDVYLSNSDETFNEAVLMGEFSYTELSDNQKYDQDEYVFYITMAGSTEILYQSNKVAFAYPSQYVMVVRENNGSGVSPYTIDKVSNSSTEAFLDAESEAKFSAYNAIQTHQLLPDYSGVLDIFVNGVDEEADIDALSLGEFSESVTLDKGDYSIDLLVDQNGTPLLSNHLLSLTENSNKTVFFYLNEENVDHDGDGDVDEDGDGQVDEVEVKVNSLVVDNSTRESIYDHNITLINLVDSEDFSYVRLYFVRSDETISTAVNNKYVTYAEPESINLLNNTYQVFVVSDVDSSNIILSSFELILDEDSGEKYMVVENDESSATGYSVKTINQTK
jgi:hypothetical protein